MALRNGNVSALVGPFILLGVAGIGIGYDLAKIVNDLDGVGPLLGVGAMLVGLAGMLFSRAVSASSES